MILRYLSRSLPTFLRTLRSQNLRKQGIFQRKLNLRSHNHWPHTMRCWLDQILRLQRSSLKYLCMKTPATKAQAHRIWVHTTIIQMRAIKSTSTQPWEVWRKNVTLIFHTLIPQHHEFRPPAAEPGQSRVATVLRWTKLNTPHLLLQLIRGLLI